jgi:hypothetical protein
VKNGVTVTVVGTTGTDGRVTAKTVSVPKGAPTMTLNGVIAGLTGSCPNLSFTVNGTAVVTNAATSYGGGGTCADVKNGDTRYAAATQQSDGTWLVTYLSGAVASDVTVTGAVSSASGTCPAVTFVVGGKTVVVTSTTAFSPGTCADVKNGVTVTVVGTTGTDGRVTAKTVSVPKGAPTTTLNGVIAGLTGSCPSLSFTVNGTAVVTNAATSYGGGGTCADVKNGDTRYAAATQQSDGTWLVTYLSGAVAK